MPPRDYRIGRRSTATGLAIMRSTPSETRSRRKSSAKRKTPLAVFTDERRECAVSRLTRASCQRRAYIHERDEADVRVGLPIDQENIEIYPKIYPKYLNRSDNKKKQLRQFT